MAERQLKQRNCKSCNPELIYINYLAGGARQCTSNSLRFSYPLQKFTLSSEKEMFNEQRKMKSKRLVYAIHRASVAIQRMRTTRDSKEKSVAAQWAVAWGVASGKLPKTLFPKHCNDQALRP